MEKPTHGKRSGHQRRIARGTLLCVSFPKTDGCRQVPEGSAPAAVQHVGQGAGSRFVEPAAVPDRPGMEPGAAKQAGPGKSGGGPP